MRFSELLRALFLPACFALLVAPVPAGAQGTLREPVELFNAPAGAAFSGDGKMLFVTNSARTDYGMIAGRGAVSRLTVGADGQLTMDQQRLVDGLNGPIGIAQLPISLGQFPRGTLVVVVGGRWVVKDRNTAVDDPRERGTGLVFIDPASGARLGDLYLGAGSLIDALVGHPLYDPSHVTFDSEGNVFISDVAGVGLPRREGKRDPAGILRVTVAGMQALLRGEAPAGADVAFLDVPEVPGGIVWSAKDNRLFLTTGTGIGDLVGAVLAIERGDFGSSGSIRTIDTELQPMMGACITANGSLIAAHTTGVLSFIKRGRGKMKDLRFRDRPVFLSPGQPAATTLANGQVLVVLPEMASGGRPAWRHRMQVFTLPADF